MFARLNSVLTSSSLFHLTLGPFFAKNDQISLISMHQNLAFRSRGSSKLRFSQCLRLFLFFTHFSGVEGLIYTSLGLLFAAIWRLLGLSWPPFGGTCAALSGIWEVFFVHLVPNVPLRRSQSPPGVPKRPPETPQRSPEASPNHRKSIQKNLKRLPKLSFINILNNYHVSILHRRWQDNHHCNKKQQIHNMLSTMEYLYIYIYICICWRQLSHQHNCNRFTTY